MNIILGFFIFVLGTMFGSFANVLVDRGQKRRTLLGRSKCDHCGYKLKWYDNIPIVSFLMIGGRCRKCHKKLSWQYPLVEAGMGLMFVLMAWGAGLFGTGASTAAYQPGILGIPFDLWMTIVASFYLLTGFLFVVTFVWDYKYMIIPDQMVIAGFGITLVYVLLKYLTSSCEFFSWSCAPTSNFLGAILVSGFFFVLYSVSKGRWIGAGDVKIGLWLGLIIGWQQVYFFLLIAYVLGAIVASVLLLKHKKKMKSQIPFGPFLLVSALIIMLWGEQLMGWWSNLI